MKQFDQDTSAYRVQGPSGRWINRVDRRLCRWLGVSILAFLAFTAWAFASEGANPMVIIGTAALAFAAGGLITLSVRSID